MSLKATKYNFDPIPGKEHEPWHTKYAWKFKGIKDDREVIKIEGWMSDFNIDFNPEKKKKTMLQHFGDNEAVFSSSGEDGVWLCHMNDMKGVKMQQHLGPLFHRTNGRDVLIIRGLDHDQAKYEDIYAFNAHMQWKDYGDWHEAKYILILGNSSDYGSWILGKAEIKDAVL